MSQTSAQQWSELSALYEEADALSAPALAAWLTELERESHPLLPQLRRMLEARSRMETDDFLGTLPRLSTGEGDRASERAAGQRIGPYRLVRPLGEGGMAEVWLAQRDDGAFKRQVAIKLPYPRPGRETFALRFDRERDILATLRHPHIAGLLDAGVTKEGQAWLALEYVEGQPISAFCDERRLSLRERVVLFRQVLLAVQHAHANLVIHRDLKPANILVTPQGEVRLLDFGIAKLLEAQGDAIEETELTRQAGRSMTPRYASPEQVLGLPLTTACDVYSLGVVFYELMCGERPYELKVESVAQLEHAILEIEPRAPSRRALSEATAQARGTTVKALARTLSPELDAMALRCLSKHTAARYSSVDAVLADVDRWLAGEAVLARAPGAWYRLWKFAGQHRLGVGLAVTAIVSLTLVAAVAVVLGLQARQQSARAIAARDFMLELFNRADQEKSRGADITARELLETGRRDLSVRLNGQPSLQAELLQGIGTIQESMGEYVDATDTFAEAARIYATLGKSRETVVALIAQANGAVRAGNPKRGALLLRQADAVAGRPRNDEELSARQTDVEGWIADAEGDSARAKALFTESRHHALAALGPYHSISIDALQGIIYAERRLRNYEEALALQDELETTVEDSKAVVSPKERGRLAEGRAELLYSAGHYAEGLTYVRTALPHCATVVGADEDRCRVLLLLKAQLLLRLGLAEEAKTEMARLESLANDPRSPALQADALIVAFRVESLLGASPRQRAWSERLSTFGQSGSEVAMNPAVKARALLAVAESQLLLGHPDAAEHWIDLVLESESPAGAIQAPLLRSVAKSLKGISLMHRGRANEALRWLSEAQDGFAGALGKRHPLAQFFSLNIALGLDATGRTKDALELVLAAEPELRRSLGTDAPTFLRVQQLEHRLRERAGSPDALPVVQSPGSHQSGVAPDFFS